MQIVIDIDEQDYVYIAKKHCLPSCDDKTLRKNVYEMIAKGTPLPKGHGDLVDRDMQDDVIMRLNENDWQITRGEYKRFDRILFEFPVIIPADKAESEE